MAFSSMVYFTRSATTATVHGPPPSGTRVEQWPRTVMEVSADGTPYCYQVSTVTIDRWTIDLDNLTAAQKTALSSFHRTTAVGGLNTFTYTHTDGTAYSNCRFVNQELVWSRRNGKDWSTQVVLLVPSAVS